SFNVRFDGTFSSTPENFGFGFTTITDSANIVYANIDARQTGTTTSEFRYRTTGALMGNSGSGIGSTWTMVTTADTNYLFNLTLTKLATNSYKLEYFRDGQLIHEVTNSLANVDDYAIEGISF